jgi:hypothetical protein
MRFYQHGMTLLKDLRATLFRRTADSPARFFDHGGLGRERCLLCIEEFTLGREPVLFGLSIGAAICSPGCESSQRPSHARSEDGIPFVRKLTKEES